MLTPRQLEQSADTLLPLLDELNTYITNDMIRRFCGKLGRGEAAVLTGTDVWQAKVYQSYGGDLGELQNQVSKASRKTSEEIKSIFEQAAITCNEDENKRFREAGLKDIPLSKEAVSKVEEMYRRTNGEFRNLTGTTALQSQKRLIEVLDQAYFHVHSNAQSYTSAYLQGIDKLAEIQAEVVYPSGHVDRIETAVLRAVRTGVGQSSAQIVLQHTIDAGWNHVLVSSHLGARTGDGTPGHGNHFWWQGKPYQIDGESKGYPNLEKTTGFPSDPLGLGGYNCRHNITGFLPGVSSNPFQQFDSDENKKIEELNKKQREKERRIRKLKVKLEGYKTAMEETDDSVLKQALQEKYNKTALKLQQSNIEYRGFCQTNKLKPLSERLKIAKWDRAKAAEAREAARVQKRLNNINQELQQMREDGIIKTTGEVVQAPAPPKVVHFREHSLERLIKRKMTIADVNSILNKSALAFKQRRGEQYAYYSDDGFLAVKNNGDVSTIGRLDEGGEKIMEVFKKYGFY